MFLDYLKGTIQEQAKQFLAKARANPHWAQDNLIQFITYQNKRVNRGEISHLLYQIIIELQSCFVK
jgi:hypothetical protein